VDEQPKFLTEGVTEMTHAIGLPADQQEGLPAVTIPLELLGLISVFDTHKPTEEEFEQCEHYELTSQDVIFDPHDPLFAQQEAAFTYFCGQLLPTGDRVEPRRVYQVVSSYHEQEDESDQAIVRSLYRDLEGTVRISSVSTQQSAPALTAEKLATNWGIGLERAEKTLQVTTQRGVHTVLPAYLSRRFRTNDQQLRYRRLPIDCFTDTMKSRVESKRGNSHVQVYCTLEGWTRAYSIKKRALAHETLSLLFARDGVPATMVMDGANEQIHGTFRKKCREAGVRVKQVELHTPFSNAAESAIRELKKGVGRQMVRSKAPKGLWDHCVERQAYIRSCTANDVYSLNGQVPETIVSG
jgi:hypothetical protein